MLAGELHNSTSSTYESLDKAVTTVKAMGLNSVVATAEWDLIEPEEGKFDFSSIDNIIRTADKHGIHVVLAWFATWKNGESGYAPLWVKSDTKKYFRCRDSKGENMNVISPYCKAAMEADSRAFAKMMEYIRDHDANRWISVIQVENECGVMSEMDHSKAGIAAFKAEVPNDLTEYLKANYDSLLPRLKQRWTENGCKMGGTWIQVFGDNDDASLCPKCWTSIKPWRSILTGSLQIFMILISRASAESIVARTTHFSYLRRRGLPGLLTMLSARGMQCAIPLSQ